MGQKNSVNNAKRQRNCMSEKNAKIRTQKNPNLLVDNSDRRRRSSNSKSDKRKTASAVENNNNSHNSSRMSTEKILASLRQELNIKDAEIASLREAIKELPQFAGKIEGDFCFRSKKNSVLIQSYKPETVSDRRRQIEDYCRDLVINNDHISRMECKLRACIEQGLKRDGHNTATVKCFPTYVRELPSGRETGKFLALDLGGTNFRVVLVDIGDHGKFDMDYQMFAISQELQEGPGVDLFDHIASCLAQFAKSRGLEKSVLPLGFTFSFPCRQKGLAVGELISWTKGFRCSGVEGKDVVALLKEALGRLPPGSVKVEVAAILNDTTGCLMSCAWKEPKCRIGLIIGTGTNACYLEDLDHVDLWEGDDGRDPRHVVINTEWGAFGDMGELDYILTKWDKAVDAGSVNPGKQIFEKMISGMYMGEVVRLVLVDLAEEDLIFAGQDLRALKEKGSFLTRYVSEVESDSVCDFTRNRMALAELGMTDVTDEDCSAVRYVCECVSRRAGFMVSAGVTALLKKMDYKDVVVAIDGSVYRHHPHFPNIMKSRIAQLMGIDYKFDLMLSTDGSGRGAALVAAVLCGECTI